MTTTSRQAYTDGLRQVADFLDEHPEVPLPYLDSSATGTFTPTLFTDVILIDTDLLLNDPEEERQQAATDVLFQVDELRREIDAFSVTCAKYGRAQLGHGPGAAELEGRLARAARNADVSMTARLDRIEQWIRGPR